MSTILACNGKYSLCSFLLRAYNFISISSGEKSDTSSTSGKSNSFNFPVGVFNLYANENLEVFFWFELGRFVFLLFLAKKPTSVWLGTATATNLPKDSAFSFIFNQYFV